MKPKRYYRYSRQAYEAAGIESVVLINKSPVQQRAIMEQMVPEIMTLSESFTAREIALILRGFGFSVSTANVARFLTKLGGRSFLERKPPVERERTVRSKKEPTEPVQYWTPRTKRCGRRRRRGLGGMTMEAAEAVAAIRAARLEREKLKAEAEELHNETDVNRDASPQSKMNSARPAAPAAEPGRIHP